MLAFRNRERVARPGMKKSLDPFRHRAIVFEPIGQMPPSQIRIALGAARRPSAHHLVGDLRVKLQADRVSPDTGRLGWETLRRPPPGSWPAGEGQIPRSATDRRVAEIRPRRGQRRSPSAAADDSPAPHVDREANRPARPTAGPSTARQGKVPDRANSRAEPSRANRSRGAATRVRRWRSSARRTPRPPRSPRAISAARSRGKADESRQQNRVAAECAQPGRTWSAPGAEWRESRPGNALRRDATLGNHRVPLEHCRLVGNETILWLTRCKFLPV